MPLCLDILDVGQGDGMVVWLPNGKVMMVDYGSTKNKDLVTHDSYKYFRKHTAFKNAGQVLEWLVLTHGDRDHYNMVEDFLTTFSVNVRNVLHGGLETDYSGLIGRLRDRKNPDGIATLIHTGVNKGFYPLASTDDLGAEVVVLAIGVEAGGGAVGYVKNTRSVVLRIVHGGIGLMLTGDATRDTEGQIIGGLRTLKKDVFQELGANVLKVAHHGSHRTSNHAMWMHAVNPNFAFISSDRSGSLDEDQKPTGHRLPQALTISVLQKYASRLQNNCVRHPYVMSYQRSDYDEYNADPDVPKQPLPLPTSDSDVAWIQVVGTQGIFSTLAIMGTSADPDDPGAADTGVQYRLVVGDKGTLEILATDDWSSFKEAAKLAV